MISLKNIHIKFNKNLISNGKLEIFDGKITSIVGESGVGKTSLLYLLGLISSNTDYIYEFDGKTLNLKDEKQLCAIKKSNIGYIFQDNNLVENLTVNENIRLAANIAGRKIEDKEILECLQYVKIDIDGNSYPKQLSGGERQRIAIACVLAKKTDLIIADEPTSSLDATNTELIISILRKIANENNKKIVIATHNSKIMDISDIVYEIKDEKLSLVKGTSTPSLNFIENKHTDIGNESPTKLNYSFYFNFAKKISKRSKLQKRVMLILCAFAIAFASVTNNFGDVFLENQKDLMNTISDRELFIVNMTAPITETLDMDENLSINSHDEKLIKEVNNLNTIYPYYEIRSSGYDILNNISVTNSKIIVSQDGTENNFIFDENNSNEYTNFVIVPYFPEQNLDKKVLSNLSNESGESIDKIYISNKLAKLINIEHGNEITLDMSVCIPVRQYETTMQVGEANSNYDIDIDLSVVKSLNFKIDGILDESVKNIYSTSGNNIVYVPYNILKEILDNEQNKISDVEKFEIQNKDWRVSSYLGFVKDYNNINLAVEKILKINSNFKVVSQYQNIESMNNLISNIKDVSMMVVCIILIIIFLLMSIIYMNYILERKYEIAVLKANGLTNSELVYLVITESMLHIIKVTIISSILCGVAIWILNYIFQTAIVKYNLCIIILNLGISILSIVIPTIISVISVNKFKPDKIMRN